MEVQWSLVFFAALSLWGAGTFSVYAVVSEWLGHARYIRRPVLVLSMAVLIVGALASMTHLGHLDRIFGVLSNPGSGIFVEGLSAGLLVVLIAIMLVAIARNAGDNTMRALATVGLVPALVLAIAVGASYLMPAKPAWDVVALPLLSITSAFVMGALTVFAAMLLAKAPAETDREKAVSLMKKIALVAIGLQVIAVVVYLGSVAGAPFQEYSRSAARIMSGDLALLFWLAVIALGLAVPPAATILPKAKDSQASPDGAAAAVQKRNGYLLAIAALCAVVAAIAFRVVMFSIGSSVIIFGF